MDPLTQLTAILEEIKTRVATVLALDPEAVYVGRRRTGEGNGASAHINAAFNGFAGGTICTERAAVMLDIGFHLPLALGDSATGEPDTTQRLRSCFNLRAAFVGPGATPIETTGLWKVEDMSFTDPEDPDQDFYAGGIAFSFATDLVKR